MGLKQDVQNALGDTTSASPSTTTTLAPVEVSPEAARALGMKVREWSGWADARLMVGKPTASPYADCDHTTHTFTVNADNLVLNPNRVLLTVTPFRLRQEAVLTGCLLHEAGHARHSHWLPRTEAEALAKPCLHSDGAEPTLQVIKLARLMEEPRVEGLMARDADNIGALGLGWTMRASAAHLLPTTVLNTVTPEQRIMDLITSWALRAGRQYALHFRTNVRLRNWVQNFTTLLHTVIVKHLAEQGQDDPTADAHQIIAVLNEMTACDDNTGSTMIDKARTVLALLFPETDDEDMPEAGDGCGSESGDDASEDAESESGDDGEGDDEGEGGEGNTEPEDEGEGEDPGAGDTGDDESDEPESGEGEGEGQTGDDEAGDEPTDGESEGASDSTDAGETGDEQTGSGEGESDELSEALAALEADAKSDADTEADAEADKEPPTDPASTGGAGGESSNMAGFRNPTKTEREVQKQAEKFLRDLISPSESSTVSLTDSPSATVDPSALASWKASGGVRDPRFFIRTRRDVQPAPPVQIAVLVDVSSSMEQLQKPSALLSWALSAAALDLRNFAGRGRQMESVLIHWGSDARVIQKNGAPLPGIKEFPCNEGTYAMGEALDLVEAEMPGFFDITERPVHRLLVQFTDWELFGGGRAITQRIAQTLESGVNMLTVAPASYHHRRRTQGWGGGSDLPNILAQCKVQRGSSTVVKYNPLFPTQVWDEAAAALGR